MRALYSLLVTATVLAPLIPLPLAAQSQLPRPSQLPPAGGQQSPAPQQKQQPAAQPQKQQQAIPAPAPTKPYKPVAVKLPEPLADAGFEAMRKQLAEAAQKKDLAGLTKLVVTEGFFWEGENGDKADKKKSGAGNLADILQLTEKDTEGWDILQGYASDPTAVEAGDRKNVFCSPADPEFNEQELENVVKTTQTEADEWGYPVSDGIEVRASSQPNARVTEKLGLFFVRVMPDATPDDDDRSSPFLRIVTPSGKIGYVSADSLAPLGNDQLCYRKDASGWKITGFIGGG